MTIEEARQIARDASIGIQISETRRRNALVTLREAVTRPYSVPNDADWYAYSCIVNEWGAVIDRFRAAIARAEGEGNA